MDFAAYPTRKARWVAIAGRDRVHPLELDGRGQRATEQRRTAAKQNGRDVQPDLVGQALRQAVLDSLGAAHDDDVLLGRAPVSSLDAVRQAAGH
jgi:hypothetical protein